MFLSASLTNDLPYPLIGQLYFSKIFSILATLGSSEEILMSETPSTYGLEEKVEYKIVCLGLEFVRVKVRDVITKIISKKDDIAHAKGR